MRDPYLILGVPKGATAADIKKAFRRLAKKYHPDQSTEARAKEKFSEASAAYEILGDEKKRGAFDRGEIDAEGKPKFQGFEGFSGGTGPRHAGAGAEHFEFNFGGRPGRGGAQGFDPGDIFADLFGGRAGTRHPGGQAHAPVRGEDVQASVSVGLADSVHGANVRVSLPTGRDLEISVPAGIEEGKQIRLKGQGQPSPQGGPPGDAIVTVHIAKHPFFRVEGRDLRLDLPITLYEAVLGAKVNVPTLENPVELGIPAGSNGARTLRLRGKGLPDGKSGRGDLLVSLKIVLPDHAKDDLESFARTLAANHAYDPRKGLG
ncbi:MAG: J domain-containing protein [Beijerinckiaceae bacterium]|jgi:DnaJ-class molecular chaperone